MKIDIGCKTGHNTNVCDLRNIANDKLYDPRGVLCGRVRGELLVYATYADNENRWMQPCRELKMWGQIQDVGSHCDDPAILVVPFRGPDFDHYNAVTKLVFDHLEPLYVSSQEFNLLETSEKRVGELVATPSLHRLWDGFGGFPMEYFVRVEQAICWRDLQTRLRECVSNNPMLRLVLLGPPGAGRKRLAMLIAIHLTPEGINWVVFLDGNGHVARRSALPDDATRCFTRNDPRVRTAVTLAVGFTFEMLPSVIRSAWSLVGLFIPVDPYGWTNRDSGKWLTQWCLLPARRFEDLLEYAKQSNWGQQAGVSGTAETLDRKARGGSLRALCTHPLSRLRKPVDTYRFRAQEDELIELLTTSLEWDFNRKTDYRFYLFEREDHDKYVAKPRRYPGVGGSGHALAKMGPLSPARALFEVYYTTKLLGLRILHESTFKLFIHGIFRESIVHQQPVVAQLVGQQQAQRGLSLTSVSICPTRAQHASEDRAMQFHELEELAEDVYWYHFGPPGTSLVDAVVTCQALGSEGGVPKKVAALLKLTTSPTMKPMKPIKRGSWQQVNAALDQNPRLAELSHVELLVTAEKRTAERGVQVATDRRSPPASTAVVWLVDPLALLLDGMPTPVGGNTRRSNLHFFLEGRPSEFSLLRTLKRYGK